jgi:hypothetical protein
MALKDQYLCPICGRFHIKDHMTFHHLKPALGNISKEGPLIYVCKTCHEVLHFCHTNEELRFKYYTLDLLCESVSLKKMVELYKYKPDNCIFQIKYLKRIARVA